MYCVIGEDWVKKWIVALVTCMFYHFSPVGSDILKRYENIVRTIENSIPF